MSTDIRIGTQVAGYRLDSVIGRGGMGVVYLAEDLRLKRKVALKLLAPELASDQRFRDRFVRESELAASLERPNIVPIHDAGEADGLLYIAMRFVEGTDLKALIADRGALEPELAGAIIGQVAAALDAAHARGLVHRDVKPANVLLDATRHAYLTDFGLTKRRESVSGLTRTGQFLGTVDYAAPEQFEGKTIDSRTDVYSLGCVAFECLTGEVPYPRDSEVAAMFAHIKEGPPSAAERHAEVPRAADAVVAKAMAKAPQDRYPTAGEFAADLTEALRPAARGAPSSPTRSGRSRTRRLIAVGAGAALVAVAVLAVILVRAGSRPPSTHTSPGSSGSAAPLSGPGGSGAVARLDASGTRIVARAGDQTGFITIGGGFVWLATGDKLEKISPVNDKVIATVNLSVDDLTFGDGSLWGTSGHYRRVSANEYYVQDDAYRIDPATNRATRIVMFPERRVLAGGLLLHSFAVSGGAVWVVVKQADDHGLLVWFDERTGKELGRQTIRPGPDGIAPGEGAVWIRSNGLNPAILRIDPATGKVVATITVGGADAIAAGEGALWVADATDNAVLKIDPATNSSAGLITEGLDLPTAIGVGLGSVWVINRTSCTVARIDPGTNRVVSSVNPNVVQMGTVAAGVEGIWVGGGGFFGRAGCG